MIKALFSVTAASLLYYKEKGSILFPINLVLCLKNLALVFSSSHISFSNVIIELFLLW